MSLNHVHPLLGWQVTAREEEEERIYQNNLKVLKLLCLLPERTSCVFLCMYIQQLSCHTVVAQMCVLASPPPYQMYRLHRFMGVIPT